jgi:hypothetical protein
LEERKSKRERLSEFDKNWLYMSIPDKFRLKGLLMHLLEQWQRYNDPLWKSKFNEFMTVDHKLTHVKDVFLFASRLYFDITTRCGKKDFLENDREKFNLIIAIWLHDWGNHGPIYDSKNEEQDLGRLNLLLEKYGGDKLPGFSEMDDPWVRMNHAIITYFNIEYHPVTVGLDLLDGITGSRNARSEIAALCLHQKRIPLGEKTKLNALLRLLDACDEIWNRLISLEHLDYKIWETTIEAKKIWKKIVNFVKDENLHKLGISDEKIKELQNLCYREEIEKALEITKDDEALKELKEYLNKYKHYQYKGHIFPKMAIEDVYFYKGEIIIVPFFKELASEDDPDIRVTLRKIRDELEENEEYLKSLGLPFNRNSVRLWRSGDPPPEELEIPEPGLMPPIEKKIEENTKLGIFPTKEDFRRELVYFDEKEEESLEIKKILESERYCLLYGPPSSRKTTFSLCFGKYLKRKGYSVFYREVDKEERWAEWKTSAKRVKPYDQEKVLFIIDECHNSPNISGKVISEMLVNMKKAKFLFVTRKISPDRFYKQRWNYFEFLNLKSYGAWKDLKRAFCGVIKQFCISNGIEKCEERIGNIERIIETCAHKFLILEALLKVWKPSEEILSDVPKERVYKYYYYEYLKDDPPRIGILTKLSAIYQFEGAPISPDFLDSKGVNVYDNGAKLEAFTELKSEGIIYEKTSKTSGRMYYTIQDNPTFAKLVLETADYFKRLILGGDIRSIDEFSFEILKRHICGVKEHTALVLSSIYDSGEQEIGEKLIQDKTVLSALTTYLSVTKSPSAIEHTLNSLRKFKITENGEEVILSKATLEQWAKGVSEVKSFASFSLMLRELRNFKTEKAKEFLEMVEPSEVATIVKKRLFRKEQPKNVGLLTSLVRHFGKISKDFSRGFLNQFTDRELLELLNNSKKQILEEGKCNQIYAFWRRCRFSANVRNACRTFFDRHNEVQLYHFLGSLDLVHDGMFIWVSYWHRKFQNVYRLFFKVLLPEKLRKSSLEAITRYITQVSEISFRKKPWVGTTLAVETAKLLEELDVVDQKLDQASLEGIHNLIRIGKELNRDNFVAYIENKIGDPRFNLIEKIRESDIESLGFFLWNISDNSHLFAKCDKIMADFKLELIEKIKETLKEKETKESKLHGVTILLWSLFTNDSQLQKIFQEDTLFRGIGRESEKIGERLSFVGIFQIINPDSVNNIKFSEIQTSISNSQAELKTWLSTRLSTWSRKQRLGYPRRGFADLNKFILAVKGFRRINEENCLTFLRKNFDLEEIIEILKGLLYFTKVGNKRSRALIAEFLSWLSSQSS